ncbi:alkaline phosphatase [Aliikangiella marina]|uniref:Alkaline phosphatase n=1 Tax=Aliikangiella marina TaxID=1712262 RepID=A0A545TCH8_9GAMM|nr:alkaline phosphatase [Aliikangiella marina]TQV74886.1 alkaline phosphatase [Aliikangiella marina]
MNKSIVSLLVVSALGLSGCVDDGKDGQDGANGNDGLSSLIVQTPLAIGNDECRNGGIQIDTGIDANGNATLESGEVSDTQFVCNPAINQIAANEILNNTNNAWFMDAAYKLEKTQQSVEEVIRERGSAKNIILFVGDGMGVSTVTASRILEGQNKGMMGEENELSFDKFPFAGLAKTYNVDAQTPDSAGTMTAMMSGVKTDVGVIGVAEAVSRSDCSSVTGNELVSALELAEIAGKSTGVVSTARITHATPAATYAKSADRNWEDVSDMPAQAITDGCVDIADQLINFEANLETRFAGLDVDGIEVVFGGGRRHFLPNDAAFNSPDAVSAVEGDRTDGRDLTAEWQANYAAGEYIFDQVGFDALNTETTEKVLGLFNESHMQYEADRHNDVAGEPSISEMTEKAINILDNNDEGFFLMVESGRIDHGHHAGSAYNAMTDTIEFAKAVQAAYDSTNPEETLIIVTADHSHVFTIAGYPKRGNPILGKVVPVGGTEPSLASDDMPYTTLGYTNGRGFKDLGDETNADEGYSNSIVTGRVDLSAIDTETPGFHQESLVPLSSETHAGEDVAIYATGPGANLVVGTNEQSVVFHVMDYAGDLVAKANAVLD